MCRRQVRSLADTSVGGGVCGLVADAPMAKAWVKAITRSDATSSSRSPMTGVAWQNLSLETDDSEFLAGEVAHLKQRLLRSELARSRLAVLLKQRELQSQASHLSTTWTAQDSTDS